MLKFNIITVSPSLFHEHIKNLPFKRALEKESVQVNLINLRDFSKDNYKTVDDKPYGGGTGMILMAEPIYEALKSINALNPQSGKRTVLLSPKGSKFTQGKALEFGKCNEITFICGRYEGIDARVEDYATDIISIGDYVLSGGELPALVIMEAVTRLLPGTLEKEYALKHESHSDGTLEYPQYTRPEIFMGKKVPPVLLSGNHKEIEKWRKENSSSITDQKG